MMVAVMVMAVVMVAVMVVAVVIVPMMVMAVMMVPVMMVAVVPLALVRRLGGVRSRHLLDKREILDRHGVVRSGEMGAAEHRRGCREDGEQFYMFHRRLLLHGAHDGARHRAWRCKLYAGLAGTLGDSTAVAIRSTPEPLTPRRRAPCAASCLPSNPTGVDSEGNLAGQARTGLPGKMGIAAERGDRIKAYSGCAPDRRRSSRRRRLRG
ncbi:hypothetical protein WMF04_29050 [Sorangium sp. So ce260]|uniref:hypothetical protein n=1 Tax=Sorangium sp. So ce260 TaxID=3133291 RepID=UPI003F624A23